MVKKEMRGITVFSLVVLIFSLLIDSSKGEVVSEHTGGEPVATESYMELSSSELESLERVAGKGDVNAMNKLSDYYYLNYGDLREEGIYWQLEAARNGDCRQWEGLMFFIEDGFTIPSSFFKNGQTLVDIGKENNCSPYIPKKQNLRR